MEYRYLNFDDAMYPQKLKELSNPPKRLYYSGDISLLKRPSAGIVGSRKISGYGMWFGKTAGRRMAEYGRCVISGMALGLDSCAHLGALSMKNGKTIAVLGCGIKRCYPASNYSLKKDIENRGLVISEFEPDQAPAKWTFPLRNRIIAALSDFLIVGESGLNSGAHITAEIAQELGRNVFVSPGNINNSYALGSNKLISEGAMLLLTVDDPLISMGISIDEPLVEKENLNEDERAVIVAFENNDELAVENLAMMINKDVSEINATLTVLEMKGLISNSMGRVIANWKRGCK